MNSSFKLCLAMILTLFSACSGGGQMADTSSQLQAPMSTGQVPTSGRPGWIDKGGAFYAGEYGTAFYAVGSASNMTNPSLRRSAAETQARAALSRVFKQEMGNLVKVYQREITGSAPNTGSSEQFAQEATKGFTSMDVAGAQVVDNYYDVQEKTHYSLARMDVNFFKRQIEQMSELSQQVKDQVLFNADQAFKEMDELKNPK